MNVYLHRNGQHFGPYTPEQITQFSVRGELFVGDMAWYEGLSNWVPVEDVIEVLGPTSTANFSGVTGTESTPLATSAPQEGQVSKQPNVERANLKTSASQKPKHKQKVNKRGKNDESSNKLRKFAVPLLSVVLLAGIGWWLFSGGAANLPKETPPPPLPHFDPNNPDHRAIEAALRSEFVLNNASGEISSSDLDKVTELNLAGKGISDLRPLAGLKKLTVLHLGRNKMEKLAPLHDLIELKELTLRGNLQLSKEEIQEIEKKLSKCKIKHDYAQNSQD